jgi:hypothetical protein
MYTYNLLLLCDDSKIEAHSYTKGRGAMDIKGKQQLGYKLCTTKQRNQKG